MSAQVTRLPTGFTAGAEDGPLVVGVLRLELSELARWRPVPMGVRVRVDLGDARWLTDHYLRVIATHTWGASQIEVTGTSPRAISDATRHLKRAHAGYSAAEARHYERPHTD